MERKKKKKAKDGKLKLKYIVGIIGVLVTIAGWFLSNSDRFPFLYAVFSPKYVNATTGLSKLYVKGNILTPQDVGFSEIAELLKENLTSKNDTPIIITQIKTIDYGVRGVDVPQLGMEVQKYIELELSFSNAAEPIIEKFDLQESQFERKYLSRTMVFWGDILFWLGIITTFIGIFL